MKQIILNTVARLFLLFIVIPTMLFKPAKKFTCIIIKQEMNLYPISLRIRAANIIESYLNDGGITFSCLFCKKQNLSMILKSLETLQKEYKLFRTVQLLKIVFNIKIV